ncbi:Defensin-5 [Heterocephalus glaber]|uniref:Defensin-5 n=1 Tax=Heterocephalus glaber TaxID=10181 RepID=G5BU52_HETGA|nr:Defensin-5 [Heterocephalus glaber]
MRTLALLAAILLLALQAQAERLPGRADQAEPEVQAEEEEQVTVISFPGEESSALQDAGVWRSEICRCRFFCGRGERRRGFCRVGLFFYSRCCR